MIPINNLQCIEDRNEYVQPSEFAMQLTYKDIWLDYFLNKQYLVSQLMGGTLLTLNNDECLNSKGQSVLKFSKQFINQLENIKANDYKMKSAKVNFIVYWLKEGEEQEVKIILPELYFEKQHDGITI